MSCGRAEVRVRRERGDHFGVECLVRPFGHERLLVEEGEDACGLPPLDQVAHRLVVEVFDLTRDKGMARYHVLILLRPCIYRFY